MSDRAAYWQRLLAEWERSGLSQAEFCRRRRVKAVTFAWWKRRLKGSAGPDAKRQKRRPSRARPADFVEVALPHGLSSASALHPAEIHPAEIHPAALHPAEIHRSLTKSLHPAGMLPVANGYELVLPGGACLHLPSDFDPERVARLVRAVVAATGVNERSAGLGEHLAGSGGFPAC